MKNRILAIAIDNYSDPSIENLKNCTKDISDIISVLNAGYDFDVPTVLSSTESTTKSSIHLALREELLNLKVDETLLILYAGHGAFDHKTGEAYWQVSDSVMTDTSTWLSIDFLLRLLKASEGKHVALISDSCFSGAIFGDSDRGGGLLNLANIKSRFALTSGRLEKVKDGKENSNSPFTIALLKALASITEEELAFHELAYRTLRLMPSDILQTPRTGPLANAGDEGGVYVLKKIDKTPDDFEKRLAKVKAAMGGLYIEFPIEINELFKKVNNLNSDKTAAVRSQNYEKAARIRDEQVQLYNAIKKKVPDIFEGFNKKAQTSYNLNKEEIAFWEEIRKAEKEYEERSTSLTEDEESSDLPFPRTNLVYLLMLMGSAIGTFFRLREKFIELLDKDVLIFRGYVHKMSEGIKEDGFDKIITDLNEIIKELVQLEMDLLTGEYNKFIPIELMIGEVKLKFYKWMAT